MDAQASRQALAQLAQGVSMCVYWQSPFVSQVPVCA